MQIEQVKVALRVRPLLPTEKERNEESKISVLPDGTKVQVVNHLSRSTQNQVRVFDMDYCLGPEVNQEAAFRVLGIADMCDAIFEGKAATVMCFGQTGSGKTYTMSGNAEIEETGQVKKDGIQYAASLYIAAARDRFMAANKRDVLKVIKLRVSYLELFNERINDLLNGSEGLKCRWSRAANTFFVEDLMLVECLNAEDFILALEEGEMRRKRAEHLLNADSSRSHVLFTVYAEVSEGDLPPRHGKITFVDLAGSERLRDTGNQAEDSRSINRSLFALGNVIEKLSKSRASRQRDHIPYRSSILTQLLMDSLDGGCRTLLVACVTPSSRFVEESLRTIYFAQRTRNIQFRPVERVDATQQELYDLKTEICRLREENVLLRRALNLPETGAVNQNILQRFHQVSSGAITTSSPATSRGGTSVISNNLGSLQRAGTSEQVPPQKHCHSGPLQRPKPLDILYNLPNSSDRVGQPWSSPAQGRTPPSTRFGFHVVLKRNKPIYPA